MPQNMAGISMWVPCKALNESAFSYIDVFFKASPKLVSLAYALGPVTVTAHDPEIRDPETCDPETRDPETRRSGKVSESKAMFLKIKISEASEGKAKLSFPSRNRRMAAGGKRTHMEEHIRGHSEEKITTKLYVRGDDG